MPLLLVLISLFTAAAQKPADVVKWSVTAPAAVGSDGVARVAVTATVQQGWKLYAIEQPADGPEPLAFTLAAGAPYRILPKQIAAPKAKVQKDDNFGVATWYYEREAAFTIPVAVPASVPAGTQQISLQVTFQACGRDICLRPFTEQLPVAVSVSR